MRKLLTTVQIAVSLGYSYLHSCQQFAHTTKSAVCANSLHVLE